MRVSDYIFKRLVEKYRVEHVFMIMGGGAMHLNDAIGHCAGLQYTCNHHEQACAIAAEAYARSTGRLAVVNVTTGPGGLNTLNGLMGQWTDSVPVLYISAQTSSIGRSGGGYYRGGKTAHQVCQTDNLVG